MKHLKKRGSYNMRLHTWLESKCEDSPKLKVAVACAQDEDVLKAVFAAIHKNWIDAVLVGDQPKIVDIAQTLNFDLSKVDIIDEPDLKNACEQAVKLVSFKQADFLMKGLVDTSILLKAVLNPEFGLRTGKILSHVALLQTTQMDRFVGITDGAMNIAPDVESKKGIIDNAIGLFHNLGYDLPKVAILAAIEKVNPKMSATVDAETLSQLNYDHALVEGPFGLDNAISFEAAKHKGLTSPMAGRADILMCPDIEAGNILYKALSFMADAQVAALIVGAKCPIVLTSRADSDVSKLYSIALAKIVSAQK